MTAGRDIGSILKGALEPPSSSVAPLVFFVGAGISKPSGVPDFAEFNRGILESLSPDGFWTRISDPSVTLETLSRAVRTEVLMQLVVEEFGDKGLDFYDWLEGADFNANHQFLAAALRNGHHVVTTNVDCLIERASGLTCSLSVTRTHYEALDATELAKPGAKGQLFKLHGTIESYGVGASRYASIRFALDRVAEGLHETAGRLLSTLIRERDFVVLGYSGQDDFSVQPVFLSTETERELHWLQFKPHTSSLVVKPGNKGFWAEENAEVRRQFFGGNKDYAEIAWEDYAVRENLGARKGSLGRLYQGHVSKFIHQLMGEPYAESKRTLSPPAWVASASRAQRLVFMARVFEAARIPSQARKATEQIVADPSIANHHARAKESLARLDSMKGGAEANAAAVKSRREALDHYVAHGSFEDQIEAKLELVNALRRKGDLLDAWAELAAVETALDGDGAGKLRLKAAKIRRMLHSQRGLTWHGMALKRLQPLPITREQALESLRQATRYAKGLPREEAAALNSFGLVANANANGDASLLEEAAKELEKAFAINLRTGNWQGCYQNKRNQGWARHNLSVAIPKRAMELEDEALELNEQAGNFAAKLGPEASGEIKTVKDDRTKFLARKQELLGAMPTT